MFNQYFGRNVGMLGYGNMRMPKVDGGLDVALACSMIDTFLESGCSYFDTCYTYEESEVMLGKALVKRHPREQYMINTKLSFWYVDSAEDMQKQFDESRRRLCTEYLDFYFLHSLNAELKEKADKYDAWSFIQGLKERGMATHVGLSFHDTPELLDEILTDHPEMELVLLQINYLDWENPKVQSRRLYETARKHGIPISIMEPCKGGWLSSETSDAGKILKAANPDVSVSSWAFRFLAELEGVMTILSGMGTLEEVKDNINTLRNFTPLSDEERRLIKEAVEIINSVPSSPCTDCRYCMPHCPEGIFIPAGLNLYNQYQIHKNIDSVRHMFFMSGTVSSSPRDCTKCGACVKACPQNIDIPDYLEKLTTLALTED
jgi:predicted aldo/keto reductase-like oxidoreductase